MAKNIRAEMEIRIRFYVNDQVFTATHTEIIPTTREGMERWWEPEIRFKVIEGLKRAYVVSWRAADKHWQKLGGSRPTGLPESYRQPRSGD